MKTLLTKFSDLRLTPASCSHSKQFVVLLSAMMSVNVAFANPQGGTVTSGSATISQTSNSTVIQQNSQQAIIHWNSFNINKNEKTQFVQPSSSSVALNRINPSQGASQIYGQLSSNGQIILVNAAGINFASGSSVNVGGLIASTSDILDSNFLAGKYVFDQASTYRGASITNAGRIIAANYGLVALLGSRVSNSGYIQAEMGNVVLGSGSKFTLDFNGDQLINFVVNSPADSTGNITNTGSLISDGGKILVSAQTAQSVLDNVIDMGGVAQANSVSQQNGEIVLTTNGGVSATGSLSAKGVTTGTTGGAIQVIANEVTTSSQSVTDVSGDAGAGSINFAANSMALAGQMKAVGTGTGAVGGNILLTSDAIQLIRANINANGTTGGGTVDFAAADSSPYSFVSLGYGSVVQANAMSSGLGGTISFNSATTSFADSLVSAMGIGAGTIGGTIQVFSNAINITNGSWLTASGDLLGGSVTLSGVANQANAANILLDSFSAVSADGTGSDGVLGGNINLYANNNQIFGTLSAVDGNTGGIGGNIGIYGVNLYIQPGAVIDTDANFLGGSVTLGGNPFSTTSSTASSLVNIAAFSYIGAAATGNNGFGDSIVVSANTVNIAGELDVSGNPFPYITYSSSGSSNNNNMGMGGMCGGGGRSGGYLTPTINNSGSSAGDINVTGNNITVASTGYLNAAGNVYGGQILLGNNASSASPSASVTINAGSLLDAGAYGTTGNPIGGQIIMSATNTTVNGTLNVSGVANSGSLGGEVEIFAQNTVNIGSSATILANADNAGEVLIGGDLNGAGNDSNALYTNVANGSVISASSLSNGNGGEVGIWSNDETQFFGAISAKGGPQGGNGGEVVVSSGGTLELSNTSYINVSAPKGTAGTVSENGSTIVMQQPHHFRW